MKNSFQKNIFHIAPIAVIYYCTINWIFREALYVRSLMKSLKLKHCRGSMLCNPQIHFFFVSSSCNCSHLNFIFVRYYFSIFEIPSEIRNRFYGGREREREGMEKKRFQWQSKRRNGSFEICRFICSINKNSNAKEGHQTKFWICRMNNF